MSTSTYKCFCGQSSVTLPVNKSEGGLITSLGPSSQIKCHCKDCQLKSGTAFSSNTLVLEKDVKFAGKVKDYVSKAASGNDVIHTFCGNCGSNLAHNTKAFGDKMAIQTGILGFSDVPYVAELFEKDRWTGVEAVKARL
ncbi:hypothetical protein JCM8097_000003 [Rhodosporidiobolus ruineniae]